VEAKTGPTPAELLNRAVGLQPLVAKHTTTSEITRRASDEVINALIEAGLSAYVRPDGSAATGRAHGRFST
jgi:hypothetical protein